MTYRKGQITISKPTSNVRAENVVRIKIEDTSSNCKAVDIEMGLEAFGTALFGLGFVECDYWVNESGVLGKIHEYKNEVVEIPRFPYGDTAKAAAERDRIISAALAPHEIDGWQARRSDAENNHRWRGEGPNGGMMTEIHFDRHIPPSEPAP